MTYYNYNPTQTYSFTAFSSSDLFGSGNAGCGATFEMPSGASACFTVTDNDAYLSGDSCYNDKADDYSGQTATIEGPNGNLGNGGQIYAESFFWVSDQNGNWYMLVEIEQEGSHEKYYTFNDAYGMPSDDAQLKLGSQCNVTGNGIKFNDLDAGAQCEPLSTITGRLFIDADHDNTEWNATTHSWEAGFDGATVELIDAHGNVVATTTTDHYGTYNFADVAAGDYSVRFEEPGGYDFVQKDVGASGEDSDADQTTGQTIQFHVAAGSQICNIDAGIKQEPQPGSVTGRLFLDADGDNTELNGATLDAGIADATVKLLDANGNVVATTTTDADGTYLFENVSTGHYTVQFEEPENTSFVQKDVGDYRYDSDADVDTGKTVKFYVGAGCDVSEIDAGVKAEVGTVTGTVFCDVACDGINGEIVTVPGATVTIEAERMEKCGFSTEHGAQASGGALVKLNGTNSSVDGYLRTHFSGQDGTYDIKLYVQDENDGQSKIWVKIDGVLIEAVRLNRDSDGSGGNNDGFSVFVIEDVQVDAHDEILLIADGNCNEYVRIDKIDFVGEPVTQMVSEPVKAGVTIKLLDAAGAVVATTTTDADGTYTFENVPVGDYTIMGVTPDGTEFTIQDAGSDDTIDSDVDENGMSGTFTVVSGGISDIDLGVCDKPEPGSISGRYFCDTDDNDLDDGQATDPGIAGVLVTLVDAGGNDIATTTTAADGTYSFDGLDAGSYSVRFTDPDGVLEGKSLVNANVGMDDTIDSDAIGDTTLSEIAGITVVAGQDTPDNDAGAEYLLGALEGRVFCDENDNDVDDDEPGVADVTVNLFTAAGVFVATTMTDTDGSYSFTDLEQGDYVVEVIESTAGGKVFVVQDQGGDDTVDSDVDQTTGRTAPVTVVAGQTTRDVDAGVEDPRDGAIGDKVFLDRNRDGIQNNGETGVSGVGVVLTAAGLDGVFGSADDITTSTTTDADGMYLFENLGAGDYFVTFDEPDTFDFTLSNQGMDDALDSDAHQTTGQTAIVSLGYGETNLTVDAGLVSENPDAVNDDAKTCANETVTVDVLTNDTDDQALTITAVGGIDIDDEETVEVAGVFVTLTGGQLVVDGEAAFAYLDIGQSAVQTISYTVSDGLGGEATADLNVTFCGSAEDLEDICASLPSQVGYQVVSGYGNSNSSAYTIQLGSDDARLDGLIIDAAYCVSAFDPANTGTTFGNAPSFVANLYCTDGDLPAGVLGGQTGSNGVSATGNLDLINWILNQDFNGADYADAGFTNGVTDAEVQAAIWNLTDGTNFIGAAFGQLDDVHEIVDLAIGSGEGFEAGPDGIVGLILDPSPATSTNAQPFIIGISFGDLDCLC